MKPVEQTIFTAPGGDCFPACLASLLELPLSEVPNHQGADWWERYQEWLAGLGRKLGYITCAEIAGEAPAGHAILGARSPRLDCLHAVVCLDGAIVWDPHPQREMGVGAWFDWTVLSHLDDDGRWPTVRCAATEGLRGEDAA
jgi:hypothetical protein